MKPPIQERKFLSDYPHVVVLLIELLELATAAGMSDEEAEKVYEAFCYRFSQVPGNAFPILRDHIFEILSAPDEYYARAGNSASDSHDWRN
jgi:hypothetical protein